MAKKKSDGYWCVSYQKSLLSSLEPISVSNRDEYLTILSASEKLMAEYRNSDSLTEEQKEFLDEITDHWYVDKKTDSVNFGNDLSISRNKWGEGHKYPDEFKWIRSIKIGEIRGYLSIGYNKLEKLESWIPKKVQSFSCCNNNLESLKNGPREVEYHYTCNKNQLKNLDGISRSAVRVDCYDNQITDMSALPANVESIHVYNNLLTSFETFPKLDNIKVIDCRKNKLISMKGAPLGLNLRNFELKGNPIGEKTLKMIYSAMRKKPKVEYEDILNSLWDKLTQAERLIMYKTNTRLSDKIVRGYEALVNYDKISGMI
jgi:hypothetical protein